MEIKLISWRISPLPCVFLNEHWSLHLFCFEGSKEQENVKWWRCLSIYTKHFFGFLRKTLLILWTVLESNVTRWGVIWLKLNINRQKWDDSWIFQKKTIKTALLTSIEIKPWFFPINPKECIIVDVSTFLFRPKQWTGDAL